MKISKEQVEERSVKWLAAFQPSTKKPNKDIILSELQKRTFEGNPVLAYVVDSPTDALEALRKGVSQILSTQDEAKIDKVIKDNTPWLCIWDYYSMAFYETAYSFLSENKRDNEFILQSLFPAFEAGLGFIINFGSLIVGVCLPEAYRDENNRIHRSDGPAITWGDEKQYWWHGISIPAEWIENKDEIDPKLALTWNNLEQRRVLCEILTWEKILAQINPEVLDKDIDPQIGTLMKAELPDHGSQKFLRVFEEATGRYFCLLAPEEAQSALEAQSLMNQIPEELFRLGYIRS
jgi:hypothetical protein